MKTVGRVLVVLITIGLAVLVLHAAYRYLLPHWAAILFYGYAGCALLVCGSGIRAVVVQAQNTDDIRETVIIAGEKARRTYDLKGRFGRLRDWLGSSSQLTAESLVWPVTTTLGIKLGMQSGGRKVPLREVAARLQSKCYEHYLSLFTLAAVAGTYFLLMHNAKLGGYGTAFLWCMLVAVTVRLFSYTVGRTPVAAKLRRATEVPYLAFLVIIAADFVSIAMSLTLLSRTKSVQALQFADFKATAEAVYKAQEPIDILRGMSLNFHQIVTGISGLLFYAALFKVIFEFGEFKRSDEDYVFLASSANELGQFSLALKHLGKVEKWDQSAHAIKMLSLLGVNDLAAAEKEAERLDKANSAAPQAEWIFLSLTDGCVLARASAAVVAGVVRRGIDLQVRDIVLEGSVTQFGGVPSAVAEMVKVVAPVQAQYPMTHCVLLFLNGDTKDGLDGLDALHSDDALEETVRQLLLVRLRAADPSTTPEQDEAAFRAWVSTGLPQVKALIPAIKDSFDCSIVLTSLMAVGMLARYMAPETVEELTYMCDSLKKKAASEATLLKFVEARFEHITKGLPQPGS